MLRGQTHLQSTKIVSPSGYMRLLWRITVPSCGLHHCASATSEKISATSLDWHGVISLSATGTELKGRIPWWLAACGEMPGSRQALVFFNRNRSKKDLSFPRSLFGWLLEAIKSNFSLPIPQSICEASTKRSRCTFFTGVLHFLGGY